MSALSSKQVCQEERKRRFAGTVISGDTPCALTGVIVQSPSQLFKVRRRLRSEDVSLERLRVGKILFQVGGPTEPFLYPEQIRYLFGVHQRPRIQRLPQAKPRVRSRNVPSSLHAG